MTTADTYETDRREVIGHSLVDCVAWARSNPEAFSRTHVWWLRDDDADAEAVVVDADIRDELDFATGEWFGPADVVPVNREALSANGNTIAEQHSNFNTVAAE